MYFTIFCQAIKAFALFEHSPEVVMNYLKNMITK